MTKIIIPLFNDITEAELSHMESKGCMRKQLFKKNTTIFRTGNVVHEIGIVLSGSVNIENIDWWGTKSILNNIGIGGIFAESYALCREPLMVDAIAVEDSNILLVNLNTIMHHSGANYSWYPKFMHNLLIMSTRKNLSLSNRIFCTSSKTVRGRLLTYLSNESVKNNSTAFEIPFNRQQMADYLNLDRSALSKELGKMRDEGIIEFHKNRFHLINM